MNNLKVKPNTIDKLKMELDKLRPLNVDIVKSIKIDFDTLIIYNSIMGKGNTFTQQEIKVLLLDGNKICGKTEIEKKEITDYKDALDYIDEMAKKKDNRVE